MPWPATVKKNDAVTVNVCRSVKLVGTLETEVPSSYHRLSVEKSPLHPCVGLQPNGNQWKTTVTNSARIDALINFHS